jgi:hypothetical protein
MADIVISPALHGVQRVSATDDLGRFIDLADQFMKEFDLPPLEPDHVDTLWRKLLKSGLVALFGYWLDGRLVGMVGGVVGPSLWRTGLQVQELCWYVDSYRRGIPVGLKLLRALKAWGVSCGARELFLIDLVRGHDETRNAALYERLGAKLKERCYVIELKQPIEEEV